MKTLTSIFMAATLFLSCSSEGSPAAKSPATQKPAEEAVVREKSKKPEVSKSFEIVGNKDGVFRYNIATGVMTKECDYPATDLWLVDETSVLFIDKKNMMLRLCDLARKEAVAVAPIRLGENGPTPGDVRLFLRKDKQYACLFLHAKEELHAANQPARAPIVGAATMVVSLVKGTVRYEVQRTDELPTGDPEECTPTPDGWQVLREPPVHLGGALILSAVLPTADNKWLIVSGVVSTDVHDFSPPTPVFFLERSTGNVYPLLEGEWPSPIDRGISDESALEKLTISVPSDRVAFAVHSEGCVAVGSYFICLGRFVRKVGGEMATSYRYPMRGHL